MPAASAQQSARIDSRDLPRLPQWINLILPGGGLILCGGTVAGLLVGVLFCITAALAIASTLLIPDDFSSAAQRLLILSSALVYIAAQFLIAQRLRRDFVACRARLRHDALAEALRCIESGDGESAWSALQPLEAEVPHDLLVALRRAQAAELCRPAGEAEAAWAHLRRLDRHHLYRREFVARASRATQSPTPAENAATRRD